MKVGYCQGKGGILLGCYRDVVGMKTGYRCCRDVVAMKGEMLSG